MQTTALPMPVKRAIHRRAHQLATTIAFRQLSDDLAAHAFELMDAPGATIEDVIERLDQTAIRLQASALIQM